MGGVRGLLTCGVGDVARALVILTLTGGSALAGQNDVPPGDTARDGAELYDAGCAACHGPTGRGASPSVVGFDIPLPDFTDCRFASREPDGDWLAVVHEGGPVRGFDAMMPAFGDAWDNADAQRVLDHVRGFCEDTAWPRGELNLPRALVTEKAYPEDEAVLTTIVSAENPGAVGNEVLYEKRFGARSQFEVSVPFAAVEQATGGWRGGVGDIALGVKHALAHSQRHGSIFSLGGEIVLPTGDEDAGFGRGTPVVEPFAAYGQILPADSFVQAQAGFELPADTDRAEREAFWRVVVGKSFTRGRFGRTWSPMLEVLAGRELVSGEAVQWDLLPQVQVTLNTRQHVMANLGVRVPVTDAGRRDTQVLFYVLWDWFDGGFFEGW